MQNTDKIVDQAIEKLIDWQNQRKAEGKLLDPIFKQHLDKALQCKLEGKISEHTQNTYLKAFEVPQIVLFDILTNRFPLLQEGQLTAERAFIETSKHAKNICILDIGIGRGFQMMRLLDSLNKTLQPEHVTLIGVELTENAIKFTEAELNKKRNTYSFPLDFHLLHMDAESLTASHLKDKIPDHIDCLLVNASLTLHHIQDKNRRIELLSLIKSFHPNLFVLIEPNADTMTNSYEDRLLNAAQHFSALYEYVNTLNMNAEESRSLKTFFSNDFFDPVALDDPYRFERLQTAEEWIKLAKEAGLTTANIQSHADRSKLLEIDTEFMQAGYINYSYRNTSLLSVIGFC